MSKVIQFMKPYTHLILCAFALLVVEAACALMLPGYMADIVNDGVLPGNISFIWRTGMIMILITIVSVGAALATGNFAAKTASGVANDLRRAVFKKTLHFSNAEMDSFATSSLITRTTNDITLIQTNLMTAIRQLIYAPVLGIGSIIGALNRSVHLTWIIILIAICMVGVFVIIMAIGLPKVKIMQSLIDRVNLVSRENLTGILIVRAFCTQKFEQKRFNAENTILTKTSLFVSQTFAFMTPLVFLILNLSMVVIIWVGAHEASAHRVDIGDIFAFMQYGGLVIFAFMMVSITLLFMPQAIVAAERVKEVLETPNSIRFKSKGLKFSKDFTGAVEFRNVSFAYPKSDEYVLKNINFTARPGQVTAIIGSTGSGKTTILQLLLRFYDVSAGAVCVDGIDIRELSKQELLDKIGYVPQKTFLFSGNIRSNLIYGDKNAAEDKVQKAVAIAQAAAFIEAKPEGFDSTVTQGGSNLSGGQKQRLSIARALVKNTPIYLFDDSFSALDLKTDSLLRAALKKEAGDKTMLIVAQRVSSIMDADQILVLDNGKIAGCGTHAELMKNCFVYQEIAASQLEAGA